MENNYMYKTKQKTKEQNNNKNVLASKCLQSLLGGLIGIPKRDWVQTNLYNVKKLDITWIRIYFQGNKTVS